MIMMAESSGAGSSFLVGIGHSDGHVEGGLQDLHAPALSPGPESLHLGTSICECLHHLQLGLGGTGAVLGIGSSLCRGSGRKPMEDEGSA